MSKALADLKLNIPKPKFKTFTELIPVSFGLLFKSFWFITKTSIWILLPNLLFKIFVLGELEHPAHTLVYNFEKLLYDLATLVLDSLLIPALLYGYAHYLKKKTFPSVLEAYRFGYSRLAPMIGWGLAIAVLVMFATLMLIVPGILTLLAFSFYPIIICFESKSSKNILIRSRELTLGYRRMIFFSYASLFLIVFLPYVIPLAMAYAVFYHLGWMPVFEWLSIPWDFLFMVVSQVVYIALFLIYLKAVKEKKKKLKEVWPLTWFKHKVLW
jgi:hypothetical protein